MIPMKKNMYKETNYFGFIIISIACFILFFGLSKIWNLDKAQLDSLLIAIKKLINWIPIILFILGSSYFARYLRWRMLLGAASVGKFNFSDAIWWFRGFALTATPAKLGEITRVHQLNKYLGYPKKKLLTIFFLERIFDFIAVIIWITLLSPNILFIEFKDFNYQILLFAICTISLFLVIFLIRKFFIKIKAKLNLIFPNLNSKKVIKVTFLGILISFCFWGIEALILWILVFVLAPININIGRAIYIYLISGIAGILSGLPGGIGVNEAASTIMLQNAGLPVVISFIISLIRRLLTVWTITGLSILSSLPLRKYSSFRKDK